MKFTEKNLEDIIFESDRIALSKRGLYINGLMLRQLRIGNYGIADLVTIEKPEYIPVPPDNPNRFHRGNVIITVYELKQANIGISTLLQAVRYAKGITSWFENSKYYENYNIEFRFVLIGSQIDHSSNFMYMSDIFVTYSGESVITLMEYKYKIDGIYFYDNSSWKLTNEGF